MAVTLRVCLLGGFELSYKGKHIHAIEKSTRLQSLLAFLILNAAHAQLRSVVAFTFWPDSTESQAHTNLRKLIYQLQKWLPDAKKHLTVESHALQWNLTAEGDVDVVAMQAALESLERQADDAQAFATVRRLHRGPLLPGVHDDWLVERREALQQRAAQAAAGHAAYYEQQGAFTQAIAAMQYVAALDPLAESAYRRLMRLRAMAGDRSGALHTYRQARTMLRDELDVEPGPATEQLAQRILAGGDMRGAVAVAEPKAPVIPLLGRREQWTRAQGMLASLQQGDAHCLLISGEAGIGKTRFAEEVLARAHLDGYLVARTRSYAAQGDLAYAPVAELLRRSALQARIAGLDDVWRSALALILPELLEEGPRLAHPASLSQSGGKLHFFEALCKVVLESGQGVMLLFDDLQWCDEETFAWLHYLLRRHHQTRLVVVGTYRDDEVDQSHPLRDMASSLYRESQLLEIALPFLEKEASSALAEAIYERPLANDERHELYESTGGNPLFIVELVRARLNGLPYDSHVHVEDARTGATLQLPPKLFALIQYRLSRLPAAAQEMLPLAALIGRSFGHELLLAASQAPEKTVAAALTELCQRRIIREQEVGRYDFTHDRLREVVLAGIGDPARRLLSRDISAAYETVYAGRLEDEALDEIAGELAVAYEEARQERAAIDYYHRAARAEIRRGAYRRAKVYLQKALALVAQAGEAADLAPIELTLQLSRANVARVIRRNKVPEARAAFERALELSEISGDVAGRFQALFGLAQYYMTDAYLAQAGYYVGESIAVAQALEDGASVVRARLMSGFIALIRGQFGNAREQLQLILAQPTTTDAAPLTTLQGQDTTVMAHLYMGCSLWLLGYPQQSDEAMKRAQAIATALGLPINLAFACFYQMLLSQIKHDIPAAGRFAERLVQMSEAYDIGFTLVAGHTCQAYVAAAQDPRDAALVQRYAEHVARYHEHVSRLSQPLYVSLYARLLLEAERFGEAGEVLANGLALVEELDDRYSAAELHRLQGVLAMRTGGDGERHLRRAMDVAAGQEARMMEMRAAITLCRLWQEQGKEAEALRLLAGLYDAFDEGFSSIELQEARALLSELRSQTDR